MRGRLGLLLGLYWGYTGNNGKEHGYYYIKVLYHRVVPTKVYGLGLS